MTQNESSARTAAHRVRFLIIGGLVFIYHGRPQWSGTARTLHP